ncbi:MAG TPA: POTRA domain-containing protein [Pyrinomonadaceae bacterium]|nr:POTRA domain-containing protein [Pyrinomonadaceae bacterium]
MPRLTNHFLAIAILLALSAFTSAQDVRVIGRIEFEGLNQIALNETLATTGLKVDQPFKVDEVDAAAQRLLDSGLFSRVGYRTRSTGNKVTITFQVEEMKGGDAPVVFDNFIWFTDDQLMEAVRREVPSFTGNAPSAGKMPEAIVRALQELLKENNLPGNVEYLGSQSESGRMLNHVFTVRGVKLQVCTLHFPGVKNVTEEQLIAAAKELHEAEYARELVRGFADVRLRAVYRELGLLRAKFATPVGKPDPKCKDGVDVTIPVDEGLVYSWGAIDWSGANKLQAEELNQILGVKAGDRANGLNFDKGLLAVRKAYQQQGHLEVAMLPTPEFDDSVQKAAYKIVISEGPQYRMGSLSYSGLVDREAKALRDAWRLRRGEVFDQSYFEDFFRTDGQSAMQRIIEERKLTGQKPPRMGYKSKMNKDTLTVDVTLELLRADN